MSLDPTFSTFSQLELLKSESAEEVLVSGAQVSEELLEHAIRVLKPSCKLLIKHVTTREMGNSLSMDLRVQGFEDIMCAKDATDGGRFVVASKPGNLRVGVSASISLGSSSRKWAVDDADASALELVDEGALLEDDLPTPEKVRDFTCGPSEKEGKKRACKDCSCGLAELEAREGTGTPMDPNIKASSCGGCYKGDAFRCANCPFLGKPAFEPGNERLVLALQDDI